MTADCDPPVDWGRYVEPIVFELRDIDHDVVRAWEKYFKGVANVRISHGDIFEKPADAIVSPANSFGYMDGGIDLVYLRRFGWELQTRLQAHLRAGDNSRDIRHSHSLSGQRTDHADSHGRVRYDQCLFGLPGCHPSRQAAQPRGA
jgi:hypothetical protein